MNFREAQPKDREFILNANKEINVLSGLNDSTLDKRIDEDLFNNKVCKSIIAEIDDEVVGMILYSYIYWANCGKGIYISQAYVKKEARGQGIYKDMLKFLEEKEPGCNFITDLVGPENERMQQAMERLEFEFSELITYYRMTKKGAE